MFEPLKELWYRVRSRFRRDDLDAELVEELKLHAEFLKEEAMRSGKSVDEANRHASLRLGNATNIRERTRERWSFGTMDSLAQDTKYAFRFLRRSPGFTAVAVLSLALGIGANATVFAVADRVMFSAPAKVANADELYQLYIKRESEGSKDASFSSDNEYPEYAALAGESKSLSAVALYFGPGRARVGRGPDAPRVRITAATANYFKVLGVAPFRGRFFLAEDENQSRTENAVVISYAYWQKQFNGADSAIGAHILASEVSLVVVGVAPPAFSGTELDAADMWATAETMMPTFGGKEWKESTSSLHILARLNDGVLPSSANAEASVIVSRVSNPFERGRKITKTAQLGSIIAAQSPATQSNEVQVSSKLVLASALVLLGACANLANLLLVRALTRRREIALRLAIGVSRARLASQMLIESIIIAGIGSGVAVVFAMWSGDALRTLVFPELQWATSAVNTHVLLYAIASGTLVAILATLIPAIRMTRSDVGEVLRSAAPQLTTSTGRLRRGLLAVQVALAVLLIVGASAFGKSLSNAYAFNLGIDVNHLMTVRYGLEGDSVSTPSRILMLEEAMRRVRTIPGVEDATVVSSLPLQGGVNNSPVRIPERELPRNSAASFWPVTPAFQKLAGFQLVRGRWITAEDVLPGMPPVVLISQSMAGKLWPNQDAVGRCVRRGNDSAPCLQVVGVIHDLRKSSFREEPPATMLASVAAPRITSATPGTLVIRVRRDKKVEDLVLPVRSAFLNIRNDVSSIEVKPLAQSLDRHYRPLKLGTTMFGSFALLAVILSALGLYGILAFSVAQRTSEFGIRSALGAQARDLVSSVVREGMIVVGMGVAVGMVLSWYASTTIAALLFQSSARDAAPYLSAAIVLGLVALAASIVPAWRATRVDPATALRAE